MSDNVLDLLTGSVSQTQDQEGFYKAMERMFKGQNLHFITELDPEDISIMVRLHAIYIWADKKIPIIPMFVQRFMQLNVSKMRRGRGEFFETLKPAQPINNYGTGEGSSWSQRWMTRR